jgi:hypothetical protein
MLVHRNRRLALAVVADRLALRLTAIVPPSGRSCKQELVSGGQEGARLSHPLPNDKNPAGAYNTGPHAKADGNERVAVSDPGLLRFPDDFLWGTTTAARRIEGARNEEGKSPSIWDTFC